MEAAVGNFQVKKSYQKGNTTKIKDMKVFELFVEKNSEKTQQQMADLWGEGITLPNKI